MNKSVKLFFSDYINFVKNYPLTLLVCIGVFVLTFSMTYGPIVDYDFWFHYNAGEYVVNNLEIPKIATNSWYAQEVGAAWISHEWLFGVMVYLIANYMGYWAIGLLAPMTLCFLICSIVIYKKDYIESHALVSFIGLAILASVLNMGATPRPHLFAYVFSFILFIILKRDYENEDNTIYFLLPLTVLWVNFHGGSYLLLFVLFGLSILTTLLPQFQLGKIVFKHTTWRHQLKRLAVLVTCLILVSVNGHGIDMYMYPITNMKDTLMQKSISEWFSPDLKIPFHVSSYIMGAFFFSALISTKKEIKAFDFMHGMCYIYLFARSLRFGPQMAIVLFVVMCDYADSLDFIESFIKKKWKAFLILYLTLLLSFIAIATGFTVFSNEEDEVFVTSHLPSEKMVEFIKESGSERLYNEYNVGGYLVYQDINVFIDGRADIYTPINFQDYLDISSVNHKIDSLLLEYNFDYLLVGSKSTLNQYLKIQTDKFSVVEFDDNFNLYKNNELSDIVG